MIGQTLSHFRITAKLGEGGMGEVYEAEDLKLKRRVALKVVPQAMAADPDRLQRFQRRHQIGQAHGHTGVCENINQIVIILHLFVRHPPRHYHTIVQPKFLDSGLYFFLLRAATYQQ